MFRKKKDDFDILGEIIRQEGEILDIIKSQQECINQLEKNVKTLNEICKRNLKESQQ